MFWLFGQLIGVVIGFIILRVVIETIHSIFAPAPVRPTYKTHKNPQTPFEDALENEDIETDS